MTAAPPVQIDLDGQDDRLIVNVRNAKYVKLVFDGMTLGVRYEDGVLYTFTETNAKPQVVVAKEAEEDTLIESTLAESTLVESQLSTTSVREWANGGYDDINEEHEFRMQMEYKWLDAVYEDSDMINSN